MRNAGTRLATVSEEALETEAVTEPPRPVDRAIAAGLMLALRTLSQKTVVALAAISDLAMIASAFVLWLLIIAQPSTLQLVGVGMYAAFVLLAVFVRSEGYGFSRHG